MRVERRERLVEQQRPGLSCKRACECDALSLAPGQLRYTRMRELGDLKPLEQQIDRFAPRRAEADVCGHVEMREERVLLEEIADTAAFGGPVEPLPCVEPRLAVDGDEPAVGPEKSRNDPQRGRLARPRGPDERQGLPRRDRQLDVRVEGAKGMGEVDPERHRVRSLTERSTVPLITTRTALIASATSKSRSNCS